MPIYEYQCKKCQNKIETISKFEDIVKCECNNVMTRLVSLPARYKENATMTKAEIYQECDDRLRHFKKEPTVI